MSVDVRPRAASIPTRPGSHPCAARRQRSLVAFAGTALALLAACGYSAHAHAEKADRDQPVQVESDRMEYDDAKKISTFIGRVVLTKGTILIRADRLVVREDAAGFQYGRADGRPASFRQKREGLEEFIDGNGLAIDYDGKAETVVLTGEAALRRFERERVLDEVHGARITYQSGSEFYTVEGQAPGAAGSDRVRMVIQPRQGAAADATRAPPNAPGTPRPPGSAAPPAAPPVPLRPSESLGTTRPGR